MKYLRYALVAVVVLLLASSTMVALSYEGSGKLVTAYFKGTPGLYVGGQVQVLGVTVGKVTEIEPEPNRVRVVMRYDRDVDVPADAKAAIVAPTLVSGRFVQLAPAYQQGPALADNATIPISKTAVPVEWDQTVGQLTELTKQLGPKPGEPTGSLGRLLNTTDANLAGQGGNIRETVKRASEAMSTLSAGGDDLFGTLRNLQSVVSNLAQNDAAVGAFQQQLAQVSGVLEDNRTELDQVVQTFDQVSEVVTNFVREHRDGLATDLQETARAAGALSDNRQALADLLQRSSVGVSNLNNTYDPFAKTFSGTFSTNYLQNPATAACALIRGAGGVNDKTNSACKEAIKPFVQVLQMNDVPLSLNPLQVPEKEGQKPAPPEGAPPSEPAPPAGAAPPQGGGG